MQQQYPADKKAFGQAFWQSFWQRRRVANIALLPIAAIFYTLVGVRRMLYQSGVLASSKAPLPIVVVGNINVGGAGKTPLVIALGKLLAENGISYAVISRGYGGSYERPTLVSDEHSADVVGDEALLIKLRCGCPVVVAKSRLAAAQLVAEHFPQVQVVLADDGLQHYQLQRDMEICVINRQVGLGNGWVLPAGGLREPPSRCRSVDFVVSNGGDDCRYHYVLADRGWYHINSGEPRRHTDFSASAAQNLALSGIAHPQLFFRRLDDLGIAAAKLSLPDHHGFTDADLPLGNTLLMTEKDWVKAKAYRHPDAWYLAVEAELSKPLKTDFLQRLKDLLIK